MKLNLYYQRIDGFLNIDTDMESNIFRKKYINKLIDNVSLKDLKAEGKSTFLLDENRFSFFSFDHVEKGSKGFNITRLNDFIKEDIDKITLQYGCKDKFLFHMVDNVSVDNQSKDHLLLQKGDIYFRLNYIFLSLDTFYHFNHFGGVDYIDSNDVKIYPKSLYTLSYLRSTLKKDSLNILYIDDDEVKLIKSSDGFYKDVFTINFGKDKLKNIFKDNNILSLYHNSFISGSFTDMTKKLIDESMMFYCDMLIKWISKHIGDGENIVFISELSKNSIFMEIFSEMYSKQKTSYILPFTFTDSIDDFGKKWLYDNADILVYFNHIKSLD